MDASLAGDSDREEEVQSGRYSQRSTGSRAPSMRHLAPGPPSSELQQQRMQQPRQQAPMQQQPAMQQQWEQQEQQLQQQVWPEYQNDLVSRLPGRPMQHVEGARIRPGSGGSGMGGGQMRQRAGTAPLQQQQQRSRRPSRDVYAYPSPDIGDESRQQALLSELQQQGAVMWPAQHENGDANGSGGEEEGGGW